MNGKGGHQVLRPGGRVSSSVAGRYAQRGMLSTEYRVLRLKVGSKLFLKRIVHFLQFLKFFEESRRPFLF